MAAKDETESNGVMAPSFPPAESVASSRCPVIHRRDTSSNASLTGVATDVDQSTSLWTRWFRRSDNSVNGVGSSIASDSITVSPSTTAISECPIKGVKSTPASIEEAANHSQLPVPGQRVPLSTNRFISSIPRGDSGEIPASTNESVSTTSTNPSKSFIPSYPTPPTHQPLTSPLWVYPSEQQFYNAMLRKGHNPPIESIPSVLRIHNAVNERSWKQVCKWEKEIHGNEHPKLVKFVGRPGDLSPRAWWNSRVMMTKEPFDRHDWYVEDNTSAALDGSENEELRTRRYVIDFYEGKESTGHLASPLSALKSNNIGGERDKEKNKTALAAPLMHLPSMYIDVRPALDRPSDAVDRMTMFMREAFPGIASVYDANKVPSSSFNVDNAESGVTSDESKTVEEVGKH